MYKCVLVLKITKNLYIVVVMLLCAKIKKKTSVKDILTVNVSCGGITKNREINILMLYIKKRGKHQ